LGAILTKTEKEEEKKGRKEAFPTTVNQSDPSPIDHHHSITSPKHHNGAGAASKYQPAPYALLPLA
jgi:hypothetical protein